MKKTILKKIISALMGIVLIICMIPTATAESVTTAIEDKDLFINQEIAENIAELFVDDMISSGQTEWNSGTQITNTEILYDELGTNIVGYSVELTDGYVVVSAYVDVPSMILEWADETEPIYGNAHLAEGTKVIYTGPMGYLLDTGENNLRSFDGENVARSQVKSQLTSLRDVKNVQASVLQEIVAEKQAIKNNGQAATTRAGDNQFGGYITDAGVYAKNVYGGTWTCTAWCNPWEDYANFATTNNFPNYSNHCGPTAITNAIKMYGNKYNNSTIKSSSNGSVFSKVIQANIDAGSRYYNCETGTDPNTANDFIKDSFKKYNVNVSLYGRYDCNLENLKNAITSDRLMYISLRKYGKQVVEGNEIKWKPYGNHAVIGYAWSRMTRSSDLGDKHFIKICDGHNSSGRYLELSLLIEETKSNKYWEIKF